MPKILVTTVPFGEKDRRPLDLLESARVEYLINPLGRKLREDELIKMIGGCEILIAGTESITKKVMDAAPNLRLISRVGVGLDSVDLDYAKSRNIQVCYTPEAPAIAVAELTIGLMFSLLRSISLVNLQMHQGKWSRYFGRRISEVNIGLIGVGRIGSHVLNYLSGLGVRRVLVNDIQPNFKTPRAIEMEWVSKDIIYSKSDLISLHLPKTIQTQNMIKREQLLSMKSDAMIINTSRGGIINEGDLLQVLKLGHLGGVAIDVFEQEPYHGELIEIERCLLSSHMGSMSIDCRSRMEIEATEEALRFLGGVPLLHPVPEGEYGV